MNTKDSNCGRSALARCANDAMTHMGCRQSSCRHVHERVHMYHVQWTCKVCVDALHGLLERESIQACDLGSSWLVLVAPS